MLRWATHFFLHFERENRNGVLQLGTQRTAICMSIGQLSKHYLRREAPVGETEKKEASCLKIRHLNLHRGD
jgi:hypothetical protein